MVTRAELPRQLGLGSAAALVVGQVIGAGIFLTPAGMATALGSPLWMLVVWLVMGLTALCGALCVGELASRYPATGGQYVYLREAYGPRVAFLFGWMSLLVLDPGITAGLAHGLAGYMKSLLHASCGIELTEAAGKGVAVAAIVALAAVNIVGVRLGAGLLRGLTVFKVGLLVFLACWGFGRGLGDWSNFTPFVAQRAGSAPLGEALASGMILAFFSFAGWWDVSKMAGEIRDPSRSLPRALVLGVFVVLALYILTSAVFLYLVPPEQLTGENFAAQAGEVLFGPTGGGIFSACVLVVILGTLTGVIMGAPRVYYAMALDGLFFRQLALIHPRFGTPYRAIGLQAILASGLVFFSTFGEVLAYITFVAVAFLAMTIFAVFVLRRRQRPAPDYHTPGYPLTPLLFLVSTGCLLVLLALSDPERTLLGVGVVLLGVPVYHLVFRRGVPDGTLPQEATENDRG